MNNKEHSEYKTEQKNATTKESVGNNAAIAETVETTLVATAGTLGILAAVASFIGVGVSVPVLFIATAVVVIIIGFTKSKKIVKELKDKESNE